VPSANRMGLAAVIAYDAARTQRVLERQPGDLRGRWEAAQARSLHARRALWIVLALAAATPIAFPVRDQPASAPGALGLLLIPVGRPLACYYYAFVAALPLLGERRADVAGIAVVLALASGILARLSRFGVDEQYAAQSLLVLLVFAFVASSFLGKAP